jgi:AAA domain
VVVLATTNQAVGELGNVGLEAFTVARFALDGCPLQSDSVVVVDELSQLPTVEADLILSAVARCERAQLWLVGDPLQTQPVRAGGLAPLIARLAEQRRIPSATLTVNRRQVDPVELEALAHFRDGQVSTSQQLRHQAGLEHQPGSPEAARAAMADAVAGAIGRHGGQEVAALAVTHADCEDVADLIRNRLIGRDTISGPAIRGPGWAGPRQYQAGDRILLHARLDLPDGRRLTNGTVATVTAVDQARGLTVRPDSSSELLLIPPAVVSARRPDGRPHLSHAWCRTIDGVRGRTWTEVHLLGTVALDRYRGYVGQSRATAGTHTWNTRPVDPGDHGGRLAGSAATPAEDVLAALQRAERKTLAAFDDPYRLAERLQRERAAHQTVLARRPREDPNRVAEARAEAAAVERDVKQSQERVAYWQAQFDATRGLSRVRPGVHRRHDQAQSHVEVAKQHVHQDGQRLRERTQ